MEETKTCKQGIKISVWESQRTTKFTANMVTIRKNSDDFKNKNFKQREELLTN